MAALQLGQAKFGSRLHVTGTDAERKAFAVAAAKYGLRVEFTDDRMNVWMREERENQRPKPPSRETLDAQLRKIAQTKATYPGGEIKSLEETSQRRRDLRLIPEREITGRVLGYTEGNEEALLQRTGGSLVRLDMRGKELLKIGKEIRYDTISRTVSVGPEIER